MQFLADILKNLHNDNLISISDLYKLQEKEIIQIILNSKYSRCFQIWQTANSVKISKNKPHGVYSVKIGAKVRYINPLVINKRAYDISFEAKDSIDKNLAFTTNNYVWLENINL